MTCTVPQTWINSVICRMPTVQSVGTLTSSPSKVLNRMESGATAPSCAHMNLHSLEFGGLIMLAGWLKCHRLSVPAVVVLQHTRRNHREALYRELNKVHMYLNTICAYELCWLGAKLTLNYSLKFLSLYLLVAVAASVISLPGWHAVISKGRLQWSKRCNVFLLLTVYENVG